MASPCIPNVIADRARASIIVLEQKFKEIDLTTILPSQKKTLID